MGTPMQDASRAFPPPPCGEGPGVGVAPDMAKRATSLCAWPWRGVLNHPHPYPPHKGEGAATSRLGQSVAT